MSVTSGSLVYSKVKGNRENNYLNWTQVKLSTDIIKMPILLTFSFTKVIANHNVIGK